MKHSLQLRLSQHLTLTPQLQQSIRLLQLSTLELNQELERILQENPLLEREDDAREAPAPAETVVRTAETASAPDTAEADASAAETDGGETAALDDAPPPGFRDEGEDGEQQQIAAEAPTLRAHLLSQISLKKLSARDHQLV
ncbi:MAG: RNA polymerase factor sigma-54, partial [Burkholderiales bacterium]